jgi:O-antigen/teichoic acid export membrane protein
MRVRRSLWNFASSAVFLVVTMLVALEATPWLVAWLGEKRYGGYRVVADGLGYLTLLELGLGGAVGPLLARALGRGDEAALRRTVAEGTRAYMRVSLITLAVGVMLTPLVPFFARDLEGPDISDLRRAWLVGLSAVLSLWLLPLRAVLEARQLGFAVNLALTGQSVFITALSLVLARAGWGMTGQAAAFSVGVWLCALSLAMIGLRLQPGLLRATFQEPRSPEARADLRALGGPSLIINVCSRVGLLADNLIVGGMLGAARVTSLVTTQRLIQAGQGVLQSVGSASWAALAELHAQKHAETFNKRLIEMSRLTAILGAAGLAPIVAFNREFVRLWMGQEVPYGGTLVAASAAINAFLLAEISLWAWCFTATGKARALLWPSVASAVVNLAASIILTGCVGLAGPLLGTTLGLVTVGLWALPWLLRREFGTSLRALAWAVLPPFVLGAVATWLLGHVMFQPSGLASLFLIEGSCALVLLAIGQFLLTPEERAGWWNRLRRTTR